jgi:hypothetical protein
MVHLGVANQNYRKILVRVVSFQRNSSNAADNYKFESSFVHTGTGLFHGKSKISLSLCQKSRVVVTTVGSVKHGKEFGVKT